MTIPVNRKKRIALTELPGNVHPGIRLNFHQLKQEVDDLRKQFLKTPGYKVAGGSGQAAPFSQQPPVPPAPRPARQEVFYQASDPVGVNYPAINFKAGYFPAHPTIPAFVVFKP